MNLVHMFRIILLISISTFIKGKGWCGGWRHPKKYSRYQICCDGKVVNRLDENNQEIGCCENRRYNVHTHDCVDGKLESFSPLEHANPATTQLPKGKPTNAICKKNFVYRLRNMKMTKNSDQEIWATVRVLNLRKLKQTVEAKWRTVKLTRINIDESLTRKYKGKTVFIFSDTNLLREKSLNLSLGDIIIKDKFRMKHIKRCSTT